MQQNLKLRQALIKATIDAFYENGWGKLHVNIMAEDENGKPLFVVPPNTINDGMLLLNISVGAVKTLNFTNDGFMVVDMTFGGKPFTLYIPVNLITTVVDLNGSSANDVVEFIPFTLEQEEPEPEPETKKPNHLKAVK